VDLIGLLAFLVLGLVAGFIARWIMPGAQPMSWVQTMVVGVIGSFVGGTLAALIFGGSLQLSAAGLIGSIVGALIVLWLMGRMGGGRRVTA
jgi:uncharacterized membrane protein YeaQ/YmgE (transglycosylase-associated protein family)